MLITQEIINYLWGGEELLERTTNLHAETFLPVRLPPRMSSANVMERQMTSLMGNLGNVCDLLKPFAEVTKLYRVINMSYDRDT